MNDQLAVRILHCLTGGLEQAQARIDRQRPGIAPLIDALPFDVLHGEPRRAIIGDATVEQSRDVAMVESSEDPPLFTEAPDEGRIGPQPTNNLERHALLELRVVALGEIHRAHATAADLPFDAERP